MKVTEMEGDRLDCWVACALNANEKVFLNSDGWTLRWHYKPKAFSVDWAHGGPIIECEKLNIWPHDDGWSASYPLDLEMRSAGVVGATPLIAAMRAFVAAKFGAEVDENIFQKGVVNPN